MAKISKKNSLKMKRLHQKNLKKKSFKHRGGVYFDKAYNKKNFSKYFENDDYKKKLFKHIKEMILKKEDSEFDGLFIKAGSEKKINKYLQIIKTKTLKKIDEYDNIHDYGTIIKRIIASINIFNEQNILLNDLKRDNDKDIINLAIEHLNLEHSDILFELLDLCKQVSEKSADKNIIPSLGKVFGPNIFYKFFDGSSPAGQELYNPISSLFVQKLIENYQELMNRIAEINEDGVKIGDKYYHLGNYKTSINYKSDDNLENEFIDEVIEKLKDIKEKIKCTDSQNQSSV